MSKKIVLIDGHSILNRAFYGLPLLTNKEGLHTNAVYGFLNILFRILDEENPDYLTVAFDLHAPTFRHKMFDDYKGTRKPMPEELREQVPVIKELLGAMNIQVVTLEGYEADDVLGTIAAKCENEGISVCIVSGDRDLLQLATANTKIRIPKTKRGGTEIEDYLESDVKEKYQVTPQEFIDVKALMGDSSDNIPGVAGIGEKTATKLIVQYHSLDGIYENIDEMKAGKIKNSLVENKETAYMSLDLARICVDAPVDFSIDAALINNFYTEEAYEYFVKLEFRNMLKKFSDNSDNNKKREIKNSFNIIEDLADAEKIFTEALNTDNIGFDPIYDKKLLGISICIDDEKVYFIKTGGFITPDYLTGKCIELIDNCKSVSVMDLKYCLNIFDCLAKEENENKIFDIGLMGYIVNPLDNSYTYEKIADNFLGLQLKSRTDILLKASLSEVFEEDVQKIVEIACSAAYTAKFSKNVLLEKLVEMQSDKLYYEIERPLAITLYYMEKEGIIADRASLEEYSVQLGERIDVLQKEIYLKADEEFNINSPKQLGEILFEKLKLPNGKKTKTGYSTSAEVLEQLKDKHDIIPLILEYRTLSKLKSTYADGLVTFIDKEDGRIRSTFQQKVTATGRISSTDPNLQNIPVRMELGRLIRKVFVPREGCKFIDADYSQIELRVLAHLSEDEKLIEAFNRGDDIHKITASQVFHIPFDEVTSLQRRNAKAVNFGIIYGISAFGLSKDLGISRKEATEYIEKYFETYPKIKSYIDSLVTEGKEHGYVTTMYGRRRPIPELKSGNYTTRSFGERVAMNSPIQGTAADIIKIAMTKVDKRLRKEGLKSRLLLQVHDELLIEAYENEVEKAMIILKEEMINAAELNVELEVDMHVGSNWYEAK